MSILVESIEELREDPKFHCYWKFYNLFRRWAEYEWTIPNDVGTVDHGIGHINRMIEYVSSFFCGKTTEGVRKMLGEKYLVLLIVSIYTHDIGMQEYYYLRLKEFEKRHPHLLEIDDLQYIRKMHARTMLTLFRSLSENINTVPFIYNEIRNMKKTNMSEANTVIRLIKTWSNELAILTGSHNQSYSRSITEKTIANDKEAKIIGAISSRDESVLLACVGFLQLADALDITKDRIGGATDINEALQLNDSGAFSSEYPVEYTWKKFRCYVVDQVAIRKTDECYLVTVSPSYGTDYCSKHRDILDMMRIIYLRRLSDQHQEDASAMISQAFPEIKIKVVVSDVEENPTKGGLQDEAYYTLLELLSEKPNFYSSMKSELENIINKDVKTYVKIYSSALDVYFGGIAINFGKFNEIIEALYFKPSDWPDFNLKTNPIIVKDTKAMLQDCDKHVLARYHDYLTATNDVKSEFFVPLFYDKSLIGFVNCHYTTKKSKSDLTVEAKRVSKSLSSFSKQFWVRFENGSKEIGRFLHLVENHFSHEERKFIRKLYSATINPTSKVELVNIQISEFLSALNEHLKSPITFNISESIGYLKADLKHTPIICAQVINALQRVMPTSTSAKASEKGLYLTINCVIDKWKSYSKNSDITKILAYIDDKTLVPNIQIDAILGFPVVAKLLMYFLGGKLQRIVDEDNDTCTIRLSIPILYSV